MPLAGDGFAQGMGDYIIFGMVPGFAGKVTVDRSDGASWCVHSLTGVCFGVSVCPLVVGSADGKGPAHEAPVGCGELGGGGHDDR